MRSLGMARHFPWNPGPRGAFVICRRRSVPDWIDLIGHSHPMRQTLAAREYRVEHDNAVRGGSVQQIEIGLGLRAPIPVGCRFGGLVKMLDRFFPATHLNVDLAQSVVRFTEGRTPESP